MQLNFREQGEGEPLIILHGLFGSLDNWESIARRLSARFRVFCVDQRNHGASPHGSEMNFSLMAEDLREWMGEQRLQSAHVMGHSMGGKTAMQFALSFPDQTKSLIAVDIAPRAYPPWQQYIFDALLPLDVTRFQNRRQIEDVLAGPIPDLTVRRFLLKSLTHDSDGKFRWKMNLPGIFRNYPSLNAAIEGNQPFPGPVLFVRGGKSDYICDSDVRMIRSLFPRAEIHTIPAAGHWVQAEAPDAFLEGVENFWRRDRRAEEFL